jgi:LacI family transcriptional regulator
MPDDGPETAEKPTLKTISRLSGLAVPTVSRALNDAPDIGAETKRTVRRIADEIGYVPNRAGVRLRTGRTNVISLVLSTEHDMMNHTARLIAALAGGLRGTPYHLNVTPFFPDEDPLKPIRYIVETRSADALVFNQTEPDDPRAAWLLDRGFPFATHGRTRWSDRHAWFDFDNVTFGRIGVERMAARGRRRIALLAPPLGQFYAQHMIAGATAAAAELETGIAIIPGANADQTSDVIRAAITLALQADPRIDGLICPSPRVAMACVPALEATGRTLGQDIDVFAKEAVPFLAMFRPEIITIHEDVGRAGAFLARAAMEAARNPDAPPMQGLDVPTDAD